MKNVLKPLNFIKSKKILKYIFNHLEIHKKLILLNYNKALQNKFGITFDDYKNNSKKIKIGGLNGYGKEYISETHKLIFEGKYLNGKKNGKGIEYFENGKKKLEGEFLNGELFEGIIYDKDGNEEIRIENGIGRKLYDNGLIQFEGKYLNEKKWNGKGYTYYGIEIYEIKNGNGYIREYYPDGSLLFKGNYINGEKNGEGKEYDHGKLLFEGHYKNGIRNGEGREYFDNLRIQFEGEYLNGNRCKGTVYHSDGSELYKLKDENKSPEQNDDSLKFYRNNIGKSTFLNLLLLEYSNFGNCYEFFNYKIYREEKDSKGQLIYEGEFMNGKRDGKGKEYNNGELIYEGEYIKGVREGKGKEYNNGELIYEGEYIKGVKDGKGKEYNYGELIFEGEYINGLRNGKGKQYFFNELIFEGEYMDGIRNGFGKEYYINNKIKFEGEFQNGKINGKGKEYDYFGRLIFEGEYVNNKKVNGIIYKYNNNNFSKYEYIIPPKFLSKYENIVPIYKKIEYYKYYHIKSSSIKWLNSKRKSKECRNERFRFDKRNNKGKKNKKCNCSLYTWR